MVRSPLNQLVFALGALTLAACAEDRSPTQPESGTETASAAAASLPPSLRTPGP